MQNLKNLYIYVFYHNKSFLITAELKCLTHMFKKILCRNAPIVSLFNFTQFLIKFLRVEIEFQYSTKHNCRKYYRKCSKLEAIEIIMTGDYKAQLEKRKLRIHDLLLVAQLLPLAFEINRCFLLCSFVLNLFETDIFEAIRRKCLDEKI